MLILVLILVRLLVPLIATYAAACCQLLLLLVFTPLASVGTDCVSPAELRALIDQAKPAPDEQGAFDIRSLERPVWRATV